ncbi:MAG: hypothetical protein R3324_16560, partial [Halobacteriales archaeon]|nr:hypothetical protein [Halobacteriales archaeon]
LDTRFLSGDVNDLAVVDPREVSSLMSYCNTGIGQTRWPSKHGYEAVYEGIVSGVVGTGNDDAVAEDILIVTGTVDTSGHVEFGPVVRTIGRLPVQEPGDLQVELVDDGEATLGSISVPLENSGYLPDVPEGFEGDPTTPSRFSAVLPDPGPAVAALVVSGPSGELDRRSASPSTPTVEILRPDADTVVDERGLEIAWSAHDADGDHLRATVQYSSDDGANWATLVVATHKTRLHVPASRLEASETARVKVIVSDGLNSAETRSERFVVGDSAPVVEVVSPTGADTVVAGDGVLFLDSVAFDAEDGSLPGSLAEWTSNLDGVLGSGAPLSLDASGLTRGCHLVSVRYVDGGGLAGTAVTAVGVGTPCGQADLTGTVIVRKAGSDLGDLSFAFVSDLAGYDS